MQKVLLKLRVPDNGINHRAERTGLDDFKRMLHESGFTDARGMAVKEFTVSSGGYIVKDGFVDIEWHAVEKQR